MCYYYERVIRALQERRNKIKIKRNHKTNSFLIIIGIFVLSSCGITGKLYPPHYDLVEGIFNKNISRDSLHFSLPKDQIALIEFSVNINILKFDGKYFGAVMGPPWNSRPVLGYRSGVFPWIDTIIVKNKLEVLPGFHEIQVCALSSCSALDDNDNLLTLKFEAKAGHIYRINDKFFNCHTDTSWYGGGSHSLTTCNWTATIVDITK